MNRRRGRSQGFTMVELLVVIAIIALLAAFLLPVIAAATASARRANCSNKQRTIFQGVRMYLNNFDEYFPLGWVVHEAGDAATKNRLGYITYWRFLIQEFCESGFSHLVNPDKGETVKDKVTRSKIFWTDPAKGYTADYFGPSILFTGWLKADGSKEMDTSITNKEFTTHTHFSQATADVASTQRPILAESDAGYPAVAQPTDVPEDWKGKPAATQHKTDLQAGWTLSPNLPSSSVNTLIGVGKSLRTNNNYAKESIRFDFRHNNSVNVLFLDGHVDMVTESNQTRVRTILDNWNELAPTTNP